MPTSVQAKPRRLGAILGLLAFAQMIIAIDYNIMFVALPDIGSDLGFSAQNLQWVISAYSVAFGGFLLLGGRATDLFGRKNMFLFGLFLYAASSVAGGLATESWLLVAARVVQGLGGAFLAPATLSLVVTLFAEGKERNRALSVWGGAGGFGMVLGAILGGLLTDWFGWQAVMWVNVIAAGAAMVYGIGLLPKTAKVSTRGFDLPGAVIGTVASTLLVFTLVNGPEVGWTSGTTIGSLIGSVALFALFIGIESRTRAPMMPLRLFGNRNVTVGTTITFLFMATFGAYAYFLTQYWQVVQGYSAWATGFAFLLPSGCVLIGTVAAGKLMNAYGARKTLLIALAVGLVGTAALALTLSQDASYLVIALPLIVLSLGQGVIFTAMFAAATTGVADEEQGIGSGIAQTGQQIGGAVGLAVLIAVAASAAGGETTDPAQLTDGILVATWATAAGIALTFLATLGLKKPVAQAVAADPGTTNAVTAPADGAPATRPAPVTERV
ncbi:MFS transporter [Streptomyces sp. NPDC090022]|uniref:MFS transporter n=1 Tax=Streptomyces sp. NPDC090022 TaxID=3365920 RepID=UPI0037FE2D4E